MKAIAFSLAVWCVVVQPASAQTIHGVVVEDSLRVPIAAATVKLIRADGLIAATTQSNSAGVFVLRPALGGRFVLHLEHPSYRPITADSVLLESDESMLVELRMARSAIPLEPLIVRAISQARLGGFYERRAQGGFGTYLTSAQIRERPRARASDILWGVPGINVLRVTRGTVGTTATANMIMTRNGARECAADIYIDGIYVQQHASFGVDDFLNPEMLEAVEVYRDAASLPGQFDRGSPVCGVVAFWTKLDPDAQPGKLTLGRVGAIAGVMLLLSLIASTAQ